MKQQGAAQVMVDRCFKMLGWRIFLHSVQMVLRNWRQALRLGLVPAILGGLAILALAWVTESAFVFEHLFGSRLDGVGEREMTDQALLFLMLTLLPQVVAIFWIAIAWHRFILLEEAHEGWLPPFRTRQILAYIEGSLVLGLVCISAAILVHSASVFIALLLVNIDVEFLLSMAAFLFLIPLLLRTFLVLPASAIGQKLNLLDALSQTRGHYWTMLVVAALGFAVQYTLLAALSVLGGIPTVGPVTALFLMLLLQSLFGASVLTTLYGVFVEKRPLG